MKECKNYDNKKDECADKDSGCLWTQGHGTNGSCTVDPKASKKLALAQVSDCQFTAEGKCTGKNYKGDPCVFEEAICQ